MKKLMLALVAVLGLGLGTVKADTNDWIAPVTITNVTVITEIEINNIVINILPTKKIQIAVDWTAKDINGAIIKTDRSIYHEAQVDAILQSQGMSVAMLRTLFLSIVAELNK